MSCIPEYVHHSVHSATTLLFFFLCTSRSPIFLTNLRWFQPSAFVTASVSVVWAVFFLLLCNKASSHSTGTHLELSSQHPGPCHHLRDPWTHAPTVPQYRRHGLGRGRDRDKGIEQGDMVMVQGYSYGHGLRHPDPTTSLALQCIHPALSGSRRHPDAHSGYGYCPWRPLLLWSCPPKTWPASRPTERALSCHFSLFASVPKPSPPSGSLGWRTETGSGESGCPLAPQKVNHRRALQAGLLLHLLVLTVQVQPVKRHGRGGTGYSDLCMPPMYCFSSSSDRPVEVDAVVILTHVSHVWSPSGLVASRPHLSTTSHLLCWDDT